MLSVLLLPGTMTDAAAATRDVARTLSALVAFVVDDVVADACVVAPPGLGLAAIEDTAGCAVIESQSIGEAVADGLRRARREHVFVLTAGFAPAPGFADEVVAAIERGERRALLAEPSSALQRLFPDLAPVVGIVAHRAAVTDLTPRRRGSPVAIARAIGARPFRTRALRV